MADAFDYEVIEKLNESDRHIIYRALRSQDNKNVIVKILREENPSPRQLAHLKFESYILDQLQVPGVIASYGLGKFKNQTGIILEDFGGQNLRPPELETLMPLELFFDIAVKVTKTLGTIHNRNIIHKNIRPANILMNPETREVKIIDFNTASEIARERQNNSLDALEDALAYISPEQTGRINRDVDYRSDYYSLGVTFYQFLTGLLPFSDEDGADWTRCHISFHPENPNAIIPEIPIAVGKIVLKLMAKNADDRYQSSHGLLRDLERCRDCWLQDRWVPDFPLAQNDVSEKFQVSQQLYGRGQELAALMDAFGNTADGHMEMLFVSGYSGIGKSALINEIQAPIVDKNGFFITGKFQQFNHILPYGPLINAFGNLTRQILTQSGRPLKYWKRQLLAALGPNGQIVIDLIPEMEKIIGPQLDIPELAPREAQYRFQSVLRQLIRGFCGKEHPLVVFIDDLQWSDPSTLHFLNGFVKDGDTPYFLFIGAYRNNEVDERHPLTSVLNDVEKRKPSETSRVRTLPLEPLDEPVVNQIVATTLHQDEKTAKAITRLIYEKTGGNPFFTTELLNALYREQAFTFLQDQGRWSWDLGKIAAAAENKNILKFLAQNIKSLSSKTQKALRIAACIGNEFDLKMLSTATGQPLVSMAKDLWEAIQRRIIIPLSPHYRLIIAQEDNESLRGLDIKYRFQHDKVLHAVYSLNSDAEKLALHKKLGRGLLKSLTSPERDERLFDIVNHLNKARPLLRLRKDRKELVELNLKAGKRAKRSTAYASAARYFELSHSLLSAAEWESSPEQRFTVLKEYSECLFLSGDIEKGYQICQELFSIPCSNLDLGEAYFLKAKILDHQAKLHEAIQTVREGLELFNTALPEEHGAIDRRIKEETGKMLQNLTQTPIEKLINLPVMKDREKIMVMRLLFQVVPPAIQIHYPLFVLVELMMFDLAMTHGTTSVSCKNFVDCGILQGGLLGNYRRGYQLGTASFKLLEKHKATALESSVYFVFAAFISHWRSHYRDSFKYFELSQKSGLNTGDIQHVAFTHALRLHKEVHVGEPLWKCGKAARDSLKYLSRVKAVGPQMVVRTIQYGISLLQSGPNRELEKELHQEIQDMRNPISLANFGHFNTWTYYLLGQFDESKKWCDFTELYMPASDGQFHVPDYYLFQTLIAAKKWESLSNDDRSRLLPKLLQNLNKLKKWSDNCPENFSHKYYLASAEVARIQGRPMETIVDCYNQSVSTIGEGDFQHLRALALELQGGFWIQKYQEKIGVIFLQEAYQNYKVWGAEAVLDSLRKRHPHLSSL